jgi:hypothetical protein
MAKFTPLQHDTGPQVDTWEVEFTQADWDEFHKDAQAYLRRITEAEGRNADNLLIEGEMLEVAPDGGICHGHITGMQVEYGPDGPYTIYSCSGLWE